MKKALVFACVVVLASCASSKLATPTQKDVDRVHAQYPNYTLADLTQGKTLYTQHCGQCHKLENPMAKTAEQWNGIVPAMVKKVNKKEGNALGAKEQDLILKYVLTMRSAKK